LFSSSRAPVGGVYRTSEKKERERGDLPVHVIASPRCLLFTRIETTKGGVAICLKANSEILRCSQDDHEMTGWEIASQARDDEMTGVASQACDDEMTGVASQARDDDIFVIVSPRSRDFPQPGTTR